MNATAISEVVQEVQAQPATLTPAAAPLPPLPPILPAATVPPGTAEPVGLPAVGDPRGPAALLRGSARGLEIVVDARAELAEIVAVLTGRLGEAPGFFRGSDVRVRVEHGPLPAGALSRLDEIAAVFELRIVEVGALVAPAPDKPARRDDAIPRANLAHGSAPSSADSEFGTEEDTLTRAPLGLPELELLLDASRAATVDIGKAGRRAERTDGRIDARANTEAAVDAEAVHEADTVIPGMNDLLADPDPEVAVSRAITQEITPLAAARTASDYPKVTIDRDDAIEPITTRVVVGPVRSGVILDHPGHLVVFGDVNPGAEIRAEGNIVVLGRLRGTAHAGIGNDSGFILALRLEPQQLRICRQVARAGDSDTPGSEAEIAYVTDASIVVERYAGRLPKNLAASI